jgi:plastocyanin
MKLGCRLRVILLVRRGLGQGHTMVRTIGAGALAASERSRRALFVLVALMAVSAVATACSSSSKSGGASSPASSATTASGGAPAAGGSTVEIKDFMFMPMTLSVAVGTTVTWKFDDSTEHTVAADDNSFTSPALGNGKTYTHAFTTAGTVKYHCSIHPFMTGTIIVK